MEKFRELFTENSKPGWIIEEKGEYVDGPFRNKKEAQAEMKQREKRDEKIGKYNVRKRS